ncbi:MAG: hypothetical protein FWG08_05250 [Propionibacteriaceae bacterium]|nr:hypothetical protein [Propionibacteriaceae bacterium]
MRVFSDLDLHPSTPIRVQPTLGEWGPRGVMTTNRKKLTRWLWLLAFIVVTAVVIGFGYYAYHLIMDAGG